MRDDPNISYESAKISFDGDVGRELKGGPIAVYRMEADHTYIWFVASIEFASNRNDFTIVISKFGLRDKIDAANGGSQFDRKTAESIQHRLFSFFMGDEEKPFFPYHINRGKCQSVIFLEGWVRYK